MVGRGSAKGHGGGVPGAHDRPRNDTDRPLNRDNTALVHSPFPGPEDLQFPFKNGNAMMKRGVSIRIGFSLFFAILVFILRIVEVRRLSPYLQIGLAVVLLAVYHSYDGGSFTTTVTIPVKTTVAYILAVWIASAGNCPAVPGCLPAPGMDVFVGWILGATLLGTGAYLFGRLCQRRVEGF